MAKKRMCSLQIIDTDAFLDMSQGPQLLYFHLLMRADDEGFINNPKKIMRMMGASEDDLKPLIVKRFILTFNSGIVVIKHWLIHNNIRTERIIETSHINEKMLLGVKNNKSYTEIDNKNKGLKQNVRQLSDKCPHSIDIDIGLDIDIVYMCISDFDQFWALYPRKVNKEKARQKFLKLKKDNLPLILDKLNQQIKSKEWEKDNGEYIPHPTTWINGKRWEDEIKQESKEEIYKRLVQEHGTEQAGMFFTGKKGGKYYGFSNEDLSEVKN